jgi:hypothetical protein
MKQIFIIIMMGVTFGSVFTTVQYGFKHTESQIEHIKTLKDYNKSLHDYDRLIDKHILLQIKHIKALKRIDTLINQKYEMEI